MEIEQILQDPTLRAAQAEELRVAHKQASKGFELLWARSQDKRSPVSYLLSLVRKGEHLRIQGKEPEQALFTCNFCGVLGGTNAENHYTNFPEHEHGEPSKIRYPPSPSGKRWDADLQELVERAEP